MNTIIEEKYKNIISFHFIIVVIMAFGQLE